MMDAEAHSTERSPAESRAHETLHLTMKYDVPPPQHIIITIIITIIISSYSFN